MSAFRHFFLLISFTTAAYASVPDSDLFPYDVSEDSRFNFGDDSFISYTLQVPLIFFNETYNTVFISGNGQVSFQQGITSFTPSCTPSTTPMIMVYWADALERSNAKLLYRETTFRPLLRKASQDVFKAFPNFRGITLSSLFIVTWKDVAFYGASDTCNGSSKANTYQLILTSDGTHSFAISMYYSKVEWTTGTASSGNCSGLGGSPAKAGFDYGDGSTLYTIPGSCTDAIINIPETSNIQEPGKWVFRIDSNLKTAGCQDFERETKQKLKLSPSVVSYFGNIPLKVEGPCLKNAINVSCVYHDLDGGKPVETEVEGVITADFKAVLCPMPYFYYAGRKTVNLKVDGDSYSGYLYVVNDIRGQEMTVDLEPDRNRRDTRAKVTWDPTFFQREAELERELDPRQDFKKKERKNQVPEQDTVDLVLESFDGRGWREHGELLRSLPNTGSFEGSIDTQPMDDLINKENPEVIIISMRRPEGKRRNKWDKLKNGVKLGGKLFKNVASGIYKVVKTGMMIKRYLNVAGVVGCEAWNLLSGDPPTDTRACPRTREQALTDGNFEEDKAPKFLQEYFHPGGDYIVRQRSPSDSGAGSQCVYDAAGALMVGHVGGGTLDRYSPNYSFWRHFLHDVLPFMACCKMSGFLSHFQCRRVYYKKRPSDDGSRYPVRRVTRAVGDPHITTFDGLLYTFNGVGEFWMVKMSGFKMQARMEQFVTPEGMKVNASVFTGAVMEQDVGGDKVVIEVGYSEDRILVKLEGDLVELGNYTGPVTIPHKNGSVSIFSEGEVLVSFSSSFTFIFSTVGPNEAALNIIGMADDKYSGRVEGLLGNMDGNPENDLRRPDGRVLMTNSTPEAIHYDFGVLWRVAENNSLFTYPPGKSYGDYSQPEFTPQFLTSVDLDSLPPQIRETCGTQMECIFDYATTGSTAIATGTKEITEKFEHAVNVTSAKIKMCSSDHLDTPDHGYLEVTNLLEGGSLQFLCDDDYHLQNGPVNCTCQIPEDGNPNWRCKGNILGVNCVSSLVPPSACGPPPVISRGYILGRNYSLGAIIEYRCRDPLSYSLYWKNCNFNGENGICKEQPCPVRYTCELEESVKANGVLQWTAKWKGYAGDVEHVNCVGNQAKGLVAFLREKTLMIHKTCNETMLPFDVNSKPYLLGC